MPRRRRISQIELSFDGLTDAVTNLVGALILLVVLLIGLTKEVVVQATPAIPIQSVRIPQQTLQGSKTVDELLRQANHLRLQVAATDREIVNAEKRVDELRTKAESLLEKAEESTQ